LFYVTLCFFFFLIDTATTEIYTLSLHDALPILMSMPFDEMMDAMVPTYQKHFTRGELDALTAFYSSPTGQKILREMPAIMSEAIDRKSTRLNSSHVAISYAVFCLKKKNTKNIYT